MFLGNLRKNLRPGIQSGAAERTPAAGPGAVVLLCLGKKKTASGCGFTRKRSGGCQSGAGKQAGFCQPGALSPSWLAHWDGNRHGLRFGRLETGSQSLSDALQVFPKAFHDSFQRPAEPISGPRAAIGFLSIV